jgi:hypothetical protein
LPAEWISRLFLRFQAIYGNRVATMWGDADRNEVLNVWREHLGVYEGDDIREALEAMPKSYKEYPPTLPQFGDLCRDARARRTAVMPRLDAPRMPMPDKVKQQLREFVTRATR